MKCFTWSEFLRQKSISCLSLPFTPPPKQTQKTSPSHAHTKAKLCPPPHPKRVAYLERKYSSPTSGRYDRGQEDTPGRCRTHFQPEEVRAGGGGGRVKEENQGLLLPRPPTASSPPDPHHTSAFLSSRKASQRKPSKMFKCHCGHKDTAGSLFLVFIVVCFRTSPFLRPRAPESGAHGPPYENGQG